MTETSKTQAQPGPNSAIQFSPVQVLEVNAQLPTSGSPPEHNPTLDNLQDVLPELNQLAQRVGGFDKLAEIVATLRGMRK